MIQILSTLSIIIAASAVAETKEINSNTFRCIQEMTPVKHFFVDNLDGNIEAKKQVALSDTGGVYPEGSVIQLVSTEVMSKRERALARQKILNKRCHIIRIRSLLLH